MEKEKNPKIKVKKSKYHRLLDVVALVFFAAIIGYVLSKYNDLPAEIPSQINQDGEVTEIREKLSLFFIPIASIIGWIIMTIWERFPHTRSYPKDRFNEKNAPQFYANFMELISGIKNIALFILTFVIFESVWIAQGNEGLFGIWFIPFVFIVIMIPIGINQYKQVNIE